MNTIKGSTVGSGGGVQAIPSGSRNIVHSLKEIVTCSESEIYAALKDCNMDPNEAVNRLLSQDPFHEVKSKREKKKEGKDISDSRPRNANNSSNRGSKNVSDRFIGRGGLTPNNTYGESSPFHGKSSFKKDNESAPYTSSILSAHPVSGKYESTGSFGFSIGASAENEVQLLGIAEGLPSGVQPTSGCQSTWVAVPGQLLMADIVKMGRPPNKASNTANTTRHNVQVPIVEESHQTIKFSEDHMSKTHGSGVSSIQHVSTTDDWPSIETKTIPVPEYGVDSQQNQEAPFFPFDVINRQSEADEVQETEDETSENPGSDDVGSLFISGRSIKGDDIRDTSAFENDLYEKMSSYQPQAHDSEHLEAEGDDSVPSVTRNLQHLSVGIGDREFPLEGDAPSLVIPDHLQVHSADFSHLSFGSFRSGISAAFSSGTMKSIPVKTNLGDELGEADISSLGHPDTRNSEYFADDSLRNSSDGSFSIRSDLHGQSYRASAASQPEALKHEDAEVAHGLQYSLTASKPSHTFADVQNLNAAYNQTSSQMENITPFSNAMHSYTNSLSSGLLAANFHPIRESDMQYSQSPFSLTQPTSSRYGNSISSIGDSEISLSEALKTSDISSTQLGHQNLSGTSVATGPPLPQNLALHPYSHPTLPLGPYGNMIGYPVIPQSYTYMPSAFQQTYLGNSPYHQSLATMLPQYKNSASVSSLPQSAAIASGYGGFGSTTTIPGNFPANPPVAPSGTTLSYDDLVNSQFKDSNHLISLQQNDNSPIWLHGGNSRTMLTVPAHTYYSYQGQNQQLGGFGQGQQSAQNYGSVGHPGFYNSQTGMTLGS